MAKVRVSDLAKRMGIPAKELLFKLQSLGVEVTSSEAALDQDVIVAIMTGRKLASRPRSVIMREERPAEAEKAPKEAVKPPRPIVKPPRTIKSTAPATAETAPPPPAGPIIQEFVEAAEAEAAEQEREAREAAIAPPPPPVEVPEPVEVPVAAAPVVEAPVEEPKPEPPPAVEAPKPHAPRPAHPAAPARSGPTGPRARSIGAPRPDYTSQRVAAPPPAAAPPRPPRVVPPRASAMPMTPGVGTRPPQRPGGPPMRAPGPGGSMRPSGPGGDMRRDGGPSRPPMGARPGRPMGTPPPPPMPIPPGVTRRRKTDHEEERPEKKKVTGRRGKKAPTVDDRNELFTKGPFSATAVLEDDLGPETPREREPGTESEAEEAVVHRQSTRRDSRKQAAPVSGRVLEFRRPDGKVTLTEGVTVKELADRLGVKANDLMKHLLMKKGLMASINQPLGAALALEIATELGIDAELVTFEEAVEIATMERAGAGEGAGLSHRGPVITVMGHVDHGKTSLLDAIRETNVAAGEAGGITQHIGAYHVEKRGRKIVFLDTPGHEAFTMMRARGAKVTDIVVLVVAADDGVMPQTREAIDHARAAGVPMIVAINKIDKSNANPDRVRKELSGAGVLVEAWGGDVVSVEVSAIKKQGIDELLDMILLTADLLELKSTPTLPARGVVLEAKKEVGRGIVANVLVQDGTLRVGEAFFSGATWGRVRAMSDENGERIAEAGPATPVSVSGFEDVPKAGDQLQVVDEEAQARMIGQLRQQKAREAMQQKAQKMSLDQLFARMQGGTKELNIILKADVQGSVEVLTDTLQKLSQEQVRVNILHSSVGAISTNDVLLASASDAIVVGFNVRPERSASELAETEGVDIRLHTVIYQLTDEIRQAMTGLLEPTFEEAFQGRAQVRDTFKVPKVGTIAGCYVTEGVIPRSASVRLLRDHRVVFEGKIASLRHFKNDVSEVRQGFECGIGIERFQDVKVGDEIEAFKVEKLAGVLKG